MGRTNQFVVLFFSKLALSLVLSVDFQTPLLTTLFWKRVSGTILQGHVQSQSHSVELLSTKRFKADCQCHRLCFCHLAVPSPLYCTIASLTSKDIVTSLNHRTLLRHCLTAVPLHHCLTTPLCHCLHHCLITAPLPRLTFASLSHNTTAPLPQ